MFSGSTLPFQVCAPFMACSAVHHSSQPSGSNIHLMVDSATSPCHTLGVALFAGSMGKRGLWSPKTRQAQLQLRADEVERSQKKKDILLALKNWPRCILPLHNKLTSLEIPMDKLGEPDPHAVLSRQASHNAQLSRGSSNGSMAGSSSDQNGVDGEQAEKSQCVPQRARVLEDLSLSLIRDHVLAKLQPTVLSSRNLKGVRRAQHTARLSQIA